MSSFAGVSVIADGELLRSPAAPTAPCETGASGYHLLVVEGHSRSRTRSVIESHYFTVGGHRWRIFYHPIWFGSMSFRLLLAEGTTGRPAVKAQFEFSFVDETGKQEPAHIHATKVLEFRGWLDSWDSAHVKFFQREALENHLKNDSFTVRCDVVVVNHATGVPVIDVPVPPSNMLQNFTDLFLSGEGTDVVFRVGGEMASAHRCVLAARSSVFRTLLFGPVKESTSSSMSTVIDIDNINMDATVFKAMLGFIYGDSVQVPDVEDDGALLDQLLVAADRYDLPRLKAICTKKLRDLRKMQVFVAVPRLCRAPVALEASHDDTVVSVKARLHDMEGIPPHRQRLVFAGLALSDDDGMTLADHGVYDSSTIQLVETNMQIFVQSFKHVTFSGITSSDTVESFRVRFQEREGCPPAQQRFRYGTKQLEDGHILADYGIRDSTTLQFTWRPAYRRRRMVELYIDVRDTVGRIKERLEEAEGIPTECQKVFFRGEELDDGRALANSDALQRGSPVVVEYQRRWSENEDATKKKTKRKTYDISEERPFKKRAKVKIGGVRNPVKKELPVARAEEIPAMQRRRFPVFLIDMGPEK